MRRPSLTPVVLALVGCLFVASAVVNNVSFMRRATGVMSAGAAASIGLKVSAEPWSKRVWFAAAGDGTYEFRVAAPLIGVVPFTSTATPLDLEKACKRLGEGCELR